MKVIEKECVPPLGIGNRSSQQQKKTVLQISRWVGGLFGRVVLALKKIALLPANCKFDILLIFLKPLPKPPHRPTRKIENKVKKPNC